MLLARPSGSFCGSKPTCQSGACRPASATLLRLLLLIQHTPAGCWALLGVRRLMLPCLASGGSAPGCCCCC